MPVYNASCWLDECLQAISEQDFTGSMELSVYDDASTVRVCSFSSINTLGLGSIILDVCLSLFVPQDDSRIVVEGWRERLEARGIYSQR